MVNFSSAASASTSSHPVEQRLAQQQMCNSSWQEIQISFQISNQQHYFTYT